MPGPILWVTAMLPLNQVKVIDFSQAMAGPACTLLLADFGAEVIKVEPPEGEGSRRWGSARFGEDNQMSGLFVSLNRNKSSVVVDLKSPEGLAAIEKLIESADVIVENFRPGVADRLGIGFERCRELKPDILYCSISGYGQNGPLRDRAGLDMLMQAYVGHMSITGEQGRPSVRTGTSPIDLLTGAHAAFGILVALLERNRSGKGQRIDLSLYDTAVHLITHYIADYSGGGGVPGKSGPFFAFLAPYGMFEASDREFYLGPDSRSFGPLCKELGLPGLVEDPRFKTNVDRLANRDALHAELIPLFKGQPADHWVSLCHRLGIPASTVDTVPEVIAHEQAAAREMIVESGFAEVKTGGIPIKLSGTPGTIRKKAPLLGNDTDRYLRRETEFSLE